MPNQYTKARAEGLQPGDEGYPEGSNHFTTGKRTEHPEEVRAKIRSSRMATILEEIAEDDSKETSSRVTAAKALLDKTISNLSSVDQTVRNETDEMDYASLKAKLKAIHTANPALLPEILGEDARDKVGIVPLQAVEKQA